MSGNANNAGSANIAGNQAPKASVSEPGTRNQEPGARNPEPETSQAWSPERGKWTAQRKKPNPDLEATLASVPFEFDFYHAVRLLECAYRDQPRIGRSVTPTQDPVRFGQNPSLAFAPSSVESFGAPDEEMPPHLRVFFFGLFGPNGALPFHLTEFARERLYSNRDASLARFLDVFHHRAISLFYRAWADSRRAIDLDRLEDSRYARYFGSFFGIGQPTMRDRDAVPDLAKLFFTGRLVAPNRNPEGLEAILSEDFGVQVKLLGFRGQWIRLPANSTCILGRNLEAGSLGQTAIVGERFWVSQLKFRLRFGPLKFPEFRRLLPNAKPFARLKDWVLNYIGQELFWDANLVLKASEVPATKLGQLGGGGLLGWTTWLKSRPFQQDSADLVLAGDS
jgi:type VI secretion system protein ImpH